MVSVGTPGHLAPDSLFSPLSSSDAWTQKSYFESTSQSSNR